MFSFNPKLKDLTILYVEDEADIREEFEDFLRNHDIPLIVAKNGQEGWELFEKHYPEIVISDIRMPILDGLDMATRIKKACPETQIIFTTAHSDTQFFLRSIEIGIDKYLLKPIVLDSLCSVLNDSANRVHEHAMAVEYEQRLIKDKIAGAKHFVMEHLSDLYPFPTLVSSDKEVIHFNKAFEKLLDPHTAAKLQTGEITLESLLAVQKGTLLTLSSYNPDKPAENKVAIRTKNNRTKIFQLFIQELNIDNTQSYQLIILNDITFLEYQNLKIKHYNMALENYITQLIYHQRLQPAVSGNREMLVEVCELPTYDTTHAEDAKAKPIPIESETPQAVPAASSAPQSKEEEILRKHHYDKIPASVYVTDLEHEVFDNTREIGDYLNTISDILSDAKESNDTSTMMLKIAAEFAIISKIMNQLFEFSDLAYAVLHLSLALDKGEIELFDTKRHAKIVILIDAICADLRDWINNIFVLQSAIDIHYLDASLFSVILQLEMELEGKTVEAAPEEDDNDFEFF